MIAWCLPCLYNLMLFLHNEGNFKLDLFFIKKNNNTDLNKYPLLLHANQNGDPRYILQRYCHVICL
jgi:hypothetical protein